MPPKVRDHVAAARNAAASSGSFIDRIADANGAAANQTAPTALVNTSVISEGRRRQHADVMQK